MAHSTHRRKQGQPTERVSPSSRRWRVVAGLGVVAVAVALVVATWPRSPRPAATDVPAGHAAAPSPTASASPAPAASDTPSHFRPLLGDWRRPDGGYVLSVTAVAPDGRAAVIYLNPRPIRVARAEARREGALVGLFVQLDDVGYPGSTYTLGYDAASGQLRGIYYQAVQRQQYEVVFVRQP
jgi:hypothetical protein